MKVISLKGLYSVIELLDLIMIMIIIIIIIMIIIIIIMIIIIIIIMNNNIYPGSPLALAVISGAFQIINDKMTKKKITYFKN